MVVEPPDNVESICVVGGVLFFLDEQFENLNSERGVGNNERLVNVIQCLQLIEINLICSLAAKQCKNGSFAFGGSPKDGLRSPGDFCHALSLKYSNSFKICRENGVASVCAKGHSQAVNIFHRGIKCMSALRSEVCAWINWPSACMFAAINPRNLA